MEIGHDAISGESQKAHEKVSRVDIDGKVKIGRKNRLSLGLDSATCVAD